MVKISLFLFLGLGLSWASAKTTKSKPEWSLLAKIFAQADSIERETWWVATQEKRPLSQSVFGKIYRAAMRENNQKLSQKNLFDCDRFLTKKEKLSVREYPLRIQFYHTCQKSQRKTEFATLEWKSKTSLSLTFYPQYLKDVVGLTTSILAKPFHCNMIISDAHLIEELSCDSLRKDKGGEETLEYEKFVYKKANQNQVEVLGAVYENIKKKRKVEFAVPLKGDIFVKETELIPPAGYRVPQPKAAGAQSLPMAPAAPIDPNAPGGSKGKLRAAPAPQTTTTEGGAQPDQIQNLLNQESPDGVSEKPSLPEPEYIEEGTEGGIARPTPIIYPENPDAAAQPGSDPHAQPQEGQPPPDEQDPQQAVPMPSPQPGPPPIDEPSNR